MADKENNATEREENLGPMIMKPSFDFKAAIKKAKKNAVDCGIFSYIAEQKKNKK